MKVLTRKGATVRSWEMLYKVVVQKILLYGREKWVIDRNNVKKFWRDSTIGWPDRSRVIWIELQWTESGNVPQWQTPWR